jgi:TDG/mug DNA glycosylase family protein
MVRGFPPIASPGARVLVLGTIPGRQSLIRGQYYGHPQNAFWPIMGHLFEAGPELDYGERTAALCRAGVAVWDVLAAADREGSLDTSIVMGSEMPNAFGPFFLRHPGVHSVFFNGGNAEAQFRRFVLKTLPPRCRGLAFRRLPSTSPANARLTRQDKLAAWQAVRGALLPGRAPRPSGPASSAGR